MTVSITGLTFAVGTDDSSPNPAYTYFTGTGTYTAADFIITAEDGLGFTPSKVTVLNMSNGNSTTAFNAAAFNAGTAMVATDEGVKVAATGTHALTIADHGIAITGEREVTIDVSVAGPITDDDDFVIEMWR